MNPLIKKNNFSIDVRFFSYFLSEISQKINYKVFFHNRFITQKLNLKE